MQFEYECDVLSVNTREFIGRDGDNVSFTQALINADGTVFQVTVPKVVEIKEGSKQNVVFEIYTRNNTLTPSIRLVGVGK